MSQLKVTLKSAVFIYK